MATLVSDIIQQSFNDLGVTKAGELISANMQTFAFALFEQMWIAWSNDQTLATGGHTAIGTLISGVRQYILGTTGTGGFNTGGGKPVRITGWNAIDATGAFQNGGRILSFEQLHALARDGGGTSKVLPDAVGADQGVHTTGASYINIEVFPLPKLSTTSLELDYYAQLPPFSTVGDTLNLPEGYEHALHFNLAIALAPQYSRQGGVPASLAANAQNSLELIRQKNAAILGLVQNNPPQQNNQPAQ